MLHVECKVLCAEARAAHRQEILEIEQLADDNQGMELTEDNIETVLDEIRPYLVGESPYALAVSGPHAGCFWPLRFPSAMRMRD